MCGSSIGGKPLDGYTDCSRVSREVLEGNIHGTTYKNAGDPARRGSIPARSRFPLALPSALIHSQGLAQVGCFAFHQMQALRRCSAGFSADRLTASDRPLALILPPPHHPQGNCRGHQRNRAASARGRARLRDWSRCIGGLGLHRSRRRCNRA
jgi:hypothetical protein